MTIRPAVAEELSLVLKIYERARDFMRENGNPDQWGDVYPPKELVEENIESGILQVLENDGEIEGVFAFFPNGDPLYDDINGEWLNSEPYVAVHRIASAGRSKGIFNEILKFCKKYSSNLRIDTYPENAIMRKILIKNGFTECGTVICADMPFIVFHKIFEE